ncbi:MAG: FHA domain-containing protein [bacterium]|nr:FHA domain-containing protein [bacterium]
MSLRLIVESEDRSQRFTLAPGPNRLGSSPGSTVRIPHASVSRRHALIHVTDGRAEIEDLGSRNGTRIGGHQIRERRPLEVGETLTVGGVSAMLEEVSEKDLEPAVSFAVRPEKKPPSPAEEPGTATAAIGTTRTFALKMLPDLLSRLAERCGAVQMSQAVGAALFDALPCLSVEILSTEGEGVLFSARHEEVDDSWPNQARAENRRVSVRAALVHPSHVGSYAPLVQTGALLIQLAGDAEPGAAPAPARFQPRPLPDPPTVVPEVRQIYADAARVSRGGVSVLIRGASGTGKEVLARYLHASSARAETPFVALNCAALPRDLLESELFGIERGVATGVESRPGKFEMADGGTLFLDEIGDMALETQARILRVLQEGEVYRLGGQDNRSADVRVLAASHRDLEAMQCDGSFRTDLYHRIADWTVRLPTLAERRADIPNLAAHFLAREARRRGLAVAGISRAAMEMLEAYAWPGNIRQLEREMARAALFIEDGELLESSLLQDAIRRADGADAASLKERLERVERREIGQALARHQGNVSDAAKELEIGLSTLYRRMRELDVEV